MRQYLYLKFCCGQRAVNVIRGAGAAGQVKTGPGNYTFDADSFNAAVPSSSTLLRHTPEANYAGGVMLEAIALLAQQMGVAAACGGDNKTRSVILMCDEMELREGLRAQDGVLYGALQGPIAYTELAKIRSLLPPHMMKKVNVWGVLDPSGRFKQVGACFATNSVDSADLMRQFQLVRAALVASNFDVVAVVGDCLSANRNFLEQVKIALPGVAILLDYVHLFKCLCNCTLRGKGKTLKDAKGVVFGLSIIEAGMALQKGWFTHLRRLIHLYPRDKMKVEPLRQLTSPETVRQLRQLALENRNAAATLALADFLELADTYFDIFDTRRVVDGPAGSNPDNKNVWSWNTRLAMLKTTTSALLKTVGLTSQSVASLKINVDNFTFLVEEKLPSIDALNWALTRLFGTDWVEWFFGVVRSMRRTMDWVEFCQHMSLAPWVAMWEQCTRAERGFSLVARKSGNNARRYAVFFLSSVLYFVVLDLLFNARFLPLCSCFQV